MEKGAGTEYTLSFSDVSLEDLSLLPCITLDK